MAVESHGLPVGVTLCGENTHDIKPMEASLRSIVTAHPEGANVCLDAGYVGAQKTVERMGYKAHIRPRGEEKQEKEKNPVFKARRWVVEVCHSWLNRFRKLLVRYEKKERNYRPWWSWPVRLLSGVILSPSIQAVFPYKFLVSAGLWKRKKNRSEYRSRRTPRARFGELVQFDGSRHDWLEGRGAPCRLMTLIDDAVVIFKV